LLTLPITNPVWRKATFVVILAVIAGAALGGGARMFAKQPKPSETTGLARSEHTRYAPTAAEWASLSVATVSERTFRAEHVTEGKIAVNEDSSTPIFSPYAGRVTKLMVKPSDTVERGQPLFIVEATDTVQGLNDFVAAFSALNSAHSKLNLAQIVEKRADDLYAGKAVPLKDWQQSQNDLTTSQNDMRSAETALEGAHDRLRILGRTEDQISTFQQTRQMSADTPIYSPIGGTVIQRKVGPGQFLNSGATDPVFVIGDLSTVWLTALCGRQKRRGSHLAKRFRSPCSRCRIASSRRASTIFLPPSTRRPAGFWSARLSTTGMAFSSLRCSPT